MSFFDSIIDIAAAPVRCADELIKDLTCENDNEEADAMLSILTFGGSSAVKGLAKSVKKAVEDLDDD